MRVKCRGLKNLVEGQITFSTGNLLRGGGGSEGGDY